MRLTPAATRTDPKARTSSCRSVQHACARSTSRRSSRRRLVGLRGSTTTWSRVTSLAPPNQDGMGRRAGTSGRACSFCRSYSEAANPRVTGKRVMSGEPQPLHGWRERRRAALRSQQPPSAGRPAARRARLAGWGEGCVGVRPPSGRACFFKIAKWRIRASIPVPLACEASDLPIDLIPQSECRQRVV